MTPWPGDLICADGRYLKDKEGSQVEKRAAIFIGPEFGTVSRPDLVAAAREAGDAGFDRLITCAFNYDAHSSEFDKLGRIPVLKARMNADLHMADDLKNAGKGKPHQPAFGSAGDNPFSHPDALRRFRVMHDVDELERALAYPWDKWTIFLHPAQRQWVERDYRGPARVSGSAGTGKTIVALHRAVHLARLRADRRVLLTTFSTTLANSLRHRLRILISNQPRLAERLEVHAMDAIGERLYALHFGPAKSLRASCCVR